MLRRLVDRQTSRLLLILTRHKEIAEADAAEAADRLAFDPSPEGDKLRRYVQSAARLVNQTLATFIKVRTSLATDETDETDPGASFVTSPLSFANQDTEGAPEPNTGHGSHDPAPVDHGAGRGSHDPAPRVTEGLLVHHETFGPHSGKVSPPKADCHNSEPAQAATQAGHGAIELAEAGDQHDRSVRSDAAAHAPRTEPNEKTFGPQSGKVGPPEADCHNSELAEVGDQPDRSVRSDAAAEQSTTDNAQSPSANTNAAPAAPDRGGAHPTLVIQQPREERIRNWQQRRAAERAGLP